ncbi:MAG: GtrA family protein [Pseudomonadota bacterium]
MALLTERLGPRAVETILRVLRFGIIGVAATLTHVAVLVLLVETGATSPTYANVLGWIAAVPVSYFGHYFFTFAARSAHGATFARFMLLSGTSLAVSQGVVMVTQALGGPYQVAALIFVVAVPAANFVLMQVLVFIGSEPKSADPEAPQ